MYPQMNPYHVVIYRGGTSKGIFIRRNELPADPKQRDAVIRAIFGSPDPRQIDGLGGADVLTSKLAIIGPPSRADADVDYTFAQVSFDTDLVDFGGNCGNISAAVGPYAIDEGLVQAVEPVTRVRIHQTNTNCILEAEVAVRDGKPCVEGDYTIAGVPGSGSEIKLDFRDTAGSTTGRVLPTGNPVDLIEVAGQGVFPVSIVDAGNVLVFVEAASLGLKGTESCRVIEENQALMALIEQIRAHAAVRCGMAATPAEATEKSAYVPFFAIVSKPADYLADDGKTEVCANAVDVVSRLYFMLHMHKTYPGTGTVATGAAARIPGTLVYQQLSAEARQKDLLRIGHPRGVINVEARLEGESDGQYRFARLAYSRTARRILEGTAYVRSSLLQK